jgi:APA family basic amino acid/polyamine antiporter
MGLGSILGTGVFVSIANAAGVAGPGVVLAVVLAAAVATANGLSSAQLAAAHPVSGGTYEYGHRFVHPAVGFAAGWMFLAAKSASAATAALGFSGYLLHLLAVSDGVIRRVAVALLLVLGLTILVAGGIRRSTTANAVIVSVSLFALSAFIVFGWLTIDETLAAKRLGIAAQRHALANPTGLLHGTALMFVAYTGYGRIATLGEEVHRPAQTIPRAIIATLVVTMVLYVLVAATGVAAVGAEELARSVELAAAPLEVVAETFAYPWIAPLVAVGAVTAMAGVLLNLVLGLSRVLLAMARRDDMPRRLGRIDAKTSSPTRAVWVVGAFIGALVLLGDVKTTWSFSAFTVLVYYGITNLSALRLPAESRRFPRWIALAGLVSCVGLAFFVERSIWMIGLALLGAGFAWRFAMHRIAGQR